MFDCPHCSAKSIGAWRKVTATPFCPAICSNCGKASFVSQWSSFSINLVTQALLPIVILFSIIVRSPYGLLAYPVAILITVLLLARSFPLIAAADSVLETRRKVVRRTWGFVVLAALVLAVIAFGTQYAG